MAKKEALRELQSRLAERLGAARIQTNVASWLAVECAGEGVLLPLAQAGEIFSLSALVPVPHTAPWFLGVANLRGRLHGVVDLAAFLGLRQRGGADDTVRDASRLVALNPSLDVNCALLVDRLAGLRSAEQLHADGRPAGGPEFAGARWRDGAGRRWQELSLSALAAESAFLKIGAAA